ncbi:MAG: co-chaperone GroES [bacterium]
MKIRPLNDWVLIRPEPDEGKSLGGIVIPDSAKEKPTRGVVLAVGRGHYEEQRDKKGDPTGEKKFVETEVKTGNKILFRRFGVDEFKADGEELVMVREADILGTL